MLRSVWIIWIVVCCGMFAWIQRSGWLRLSNYWLSARFHICKTIRWSVVLKILFCKVKGGYFLCTIQFIPFRFRAICLHFFVTCDFHVKWLTWNPRYLKLHLQQGHSLVQNYWFSEYFAEKVIFTVFTCKCTRILSTLV